MGINTNNTEVEQNNTEVEQNNIYNNNLGTDNILQNTGNKKEVIVAGDDEMWIDYIKNKLELGNLDGKEEGYLKRILKVYNMPDLTKEKGNPVEMVVSSIKNSDYFNDFIDFSSPELVNEYETFDLFNFPENHVARRKSDSYFIKKDSKNKDNSILLRPHTSVMWKYLLDDAKGKELLEKNGEIKALSSGKVYRVDDIDPTHHECFHQIDGLKIIEKSKEIITQDTLKEVLINIIFSLFGKGIEYRFNVDTFPYTKESLEVEVMFNGKWLEVLGAGIVHESVMQKLGIDSEKYNGWAFGFGIERLAMALKNIPDIRLFWSEDDRVKKQWGNFEPFKEVSNFPPVYKDISFLVPIEKFQKDENESKKSGEFELKNEADLFDIAGIVRDVAGDLVEEVKIVDIFDGKINKKGVEKRLFSEGKQSISIRITFRSLERTLTDDEINELYFQIRKKIESDLDYKLR